MKNRKPYEGKWMAAAALGALFSLQAVCTAFGADGPGSRREPVEI